MEKTEKYPTAPDGKSLMLISTLCGQRTSILMLQKPEGWLEKCISIYEDAIREAQGKTDNDDFSKLCGDYCSLLSDNNLSKKLEPLIIGDHKAFHIADFTKAVINYCAYLLNKSNVEQYEKVLTATKGDVSDEIYLRMQSFYGAMLINAHQYDKFYELVQSVEIKVDNAQFFEKLKDNAKYLRDTDHSEYFKPFCEMVLPIVRRLAMSDDFDYLKELADDVSNLYDDFEEFENTDLSKELFAIFVNIYRKLVTMQPENEELCSVLAPAICKCADDSASSNNQQAVQLYLESSDLYKKIGNTDELAEIDIKLAKLYSEMKMYEQAEHLYAKFVVQGRRTICVDKQHLRNLINLANVHRHMHKNAEADQEFAEFVMLYRGNYNKSPNTAILQKFNHAWELFLQGRYDDALNVINDELVADRTNPVWYELKGELLFCMNRNYEALAMWYAVQDKDGEYFGRYDSALNFCLSNVGLVQ